MMVGDRMLTLAAVEERVGLKKSAIYARIAEGNIPKQVNHGGAVSWSELEIDEWIEAQKRARRAA